MGIVGSLLMVAAGALIFYYAQQNIGKNVKERRSLPVWAWGLVVILLGSSVAATFFLN